MNLFSKIFVIIIFITSAFFISASPSAAQSCSGGYTCYSGCQDSCWCGGVKQTTSAGIARCNDPTSGCTTRKDTADCRAQRNYGCGEYPWCNVVPDMLSCELVTGNCNATSVCPAGQIACDACGKCMPNTQTCNQWAAAGCGGSGGPGPGGGGQCVSGYCTSAADCASKGGTQGVYPGGGACSSGLVACCISGGGTPTYQGCQTAYLPLGCTQDGDNFRQGTCNGGTNNGNQCVYDSHCPGGGRCQGQGTCCQGTQMMYLGTRLICGCPTCTPSCTNQCGQPNGCGGTCPGNDVGTAQVIITRPSNGTTVTPLTRTAPAPGGGTRTVNYVPIEWTSIAANRFNIKIYPTGTADPQKCTATGSFCANGVTYKTYDFEITPSITRYTVEVTGINGCSNQPGNTAIITFSTAAEITGNIFLDNDINSIIDPATGLCRDASATALAPGGSVRATNGGNTYPGTINGSAYTIGNLPSLPNTSVQLSIDSSQYSCVCPIGCTYSGITAPKTGVNFYLASVREPWWQTMNGLVYAGNTGGTAVFSRIPSTCTTFSGCRPFLSLQNAFRGNDSSGYVLTGGGGIDSTADSAGPLTNLREDTTNRSAHIRGLTLTSPRENYDYFASLYSIANMTPNYNCGGSCNKPGTGTYYSNGAATVSSAWNVNSGEKIVVFVNGNLQINAPIKVAQGGFLAFIVRGNITVSNTVGNTDPADDSANVEGVYVADGSLIIQGNRAGGDLHFVGAGTFVGWGGVQLNRVYADATYNASNPSESFLFRPDFMLNVPDLMTKPIYIWQETN